MFRIRVIDRAVWFPFLGSGGSLIECVYDVMGVRSDVWEMVDPRSIAISHQSNFEWFRHG